MASYKHKTIQRENFFHGNMVLFLKKLAKEKIQSKIATFYIMQEYQHKNGMYLMRELFPEPNMQEGLAKKYYELYTNVCSKNKKTEVDFDLNEIYNFINKNNPNTNEKQAAVIVYLEALNETKDIHLTRKKVCEHLIEDSSIDEKSIIENFSLVKMFNQEEIDREIRKLDKKLKEDEVENKINNEKLNKNHKTIKNLGNSAIGKSSRQLEKIGENLKKKVIKSENNIKKLALNVNELKKQITK